MANQTEAKGTGNAGDSIAEFKRMTDQVGDAIVARDMAMLERVVAEDFVFAYPLDGDGKQSLMTNLTSGDLAISSLTHDNLDARVFGSTAVVSLVATATWQYKGREIHGYYRVMQVYAERRGEWQLVTLQACPLT